MTHHDQNIHESCSCSCCQPADTEGPLKVLHPDEDNSNNECSGHHHHVNVEETSGTRLLITLVLNLIIPVIQVIAGIFAHSMALISDATHNFSDFMAILISYIAYRIGRKGATAENTFGYRRAEIMAALLNVTLLTGACFFYTIWCIPTIFSA
jgi:Co/Zn/Cd efflux system component